MKPARWEQIQAIYLDAADLPPEDQAEFLALACAGDPELRLEVESLLDADRRGDDLLDATLDDLVLFLDDLPADTTIDARPARAGPYKIVEEIGRGGMATVYRAERDDDRYTRVVALKVVNHAADDPSLVLRFQREQQILAGLEHANIARMYDAGVTDQGRPWLAMELVAGTPIHRYCDNNRLTVAERLLVFEQVCGAVDYAHRSLIVHRDLKPSNVLVTNDGTAKLLDFGIATLLTDERSGDADEPLTRVHQRVLTPEYASPEQLRGDSLTTASDVFSLGIVLHQLLTGRQPERGEDDAPRTAPSTGVTRPSEPADGPTVETIAAARGSTPAGLKRLLSGELDVIVMKATRAEPGERYPTAAALVDDLERYREGRPLRPVRPP